MPRCIARALAMATVASALSTLAPASQPDPSQCTWDAFVGVSPVNDVASQPYTFTGTLRDFTGAPVGSFPSAQLELDFGACSNQPNRPANQIPADQDSGPDGRVTWQLNLSFGGADPCEVSVLVQNVTFAVLSGHQGLSTGNPENPPAVDGGVRSPDENGDGRIGLRDLGYLQEEYYNTGIRLDYRGDLLPAGGPEGIWFDGRTDLADLGMMRDHFFAQ